LVSILKAGIAADTAHPGSLRNMEGMWRSGGTPAGRGKLLPEDAVFRWRLSAASRFG
jgi:hypothetical protein